MNTHAHPLQFLTALRVGTLAVALSALVPTQAAAEAGIAWAEPTRGVSIALDGADNVYTVDYDYNPGGDIYLTKRNADGALLWTVRYDQTDSTRWEAAQWVATDSRGNAIVAGSSMSGYSNPVNAASIVMKFNPDGRLLWRRVYENTFDGSYTRKCLVDGNDNIYVLGRAGGAGVTKVKKFSPGGKTLWSYEDADGIGAPINFKLTPDSHIVITGRAIYGSINGYAKIGLDGNKVWSYPGVYSLTVGDSAGDASGNTYLVHGEYVTNGGTVIKKLDPSGALIWEDVYNEIAGFRVEVGSDGQAVLSGFPNAGTGGAAFIKVDEGGALIWSNPDADGSLALLAHAHMLLDAGNNAYLAAGTMSEMAVSKVNSDGTSGWTQTIPFGYAMAIALANTDDSVYVVGGTTARISQVGEPAPLPAAPTDLTARATLVRSKAQVRLSWSDNATDETGYTVERCVGSACTNFSMRASLTADAVRYTDGGVARATTYRYRVMATGTDGNSPYSNIATVTTP